MEPTVNHADIAALRYCNAGARQFCKRYNIDWATFIKSGIPITTLEQIDDEMARRAVAAARTRLGIGETT